MAVIPSIAMIRVATAIAVRASRSHSASLSREAAQLPTAPRRDPVRIEDVHNRDAGASGSCRVTTERVITVLLSS